MPADPVFISYASNNAAAADRLKYDLEALGISVWLDRTDLPADASDYGEEILKGLSKCRALIYLASPAAKQSKASREELRWAKHYGLRIYPFWIDGTIWEDSAPFGFAGAEYTDARDGFADYDAAFAKLLNALQKTVTPKTVTESSESGDYETRPAIAVVPVVNPGVARTIATTTPLTEPTIPATPSSAEPSAPTTPPQVKPTLPPESAFGGTPEKKKKHGRTRARLIAAVLIGLILVSGTSAVFLISRPLSVTRTPTATSTATPRPVRWTTFANANPNLGYKNELFSVDALAADNIWAAGYYRTTPSPTPQFTLIEHWNGAYWKKFDGPNGKADRSVLNGIDALADDDVWAVGASGSKSLIEHWRGSSWAPVSSPNVGTDNNYLNAVHAQSANDIWAVGSSQDTSSDSTRTLIEHWDGFTWQVKTSPNLGSENVLYGVTALASDNAWAVGYYIDTPGSPARPLTEHWDGSTWQPKQAPAVGVVNDKLWGVRAVAPDNIWAVGNSEQIDKDPQKPSARSLIEHWDGSSWKVTASPNSSTGYNNLLNVTVLKSGDVWAVGGGTKTLIAHWDGTSWQSVTSENIDPGHNVLTSITAADADDFWAVGGYGPEITSAPSYILIERGTRT